MNGGQPQKNSVNVSIVVGAIQLPGKHYATIALRDLQKAFLRTTHGLKKKLSSIMVVQNAHVAESSMLSCSISIISTMMGLSIAGNFEMAKAKAVGVVLRFIFGLKGIITRPASVFFVSTAIMPLMFSATALTSGSA